MTDRTDRVVVEYDALSGTERDEIDRALTTNESITVASLPFEFTNGGVRLDFFGSQRLHYRHRDGEYYTVTTADPIDLPTASPGLAIGAFGTLVGLAVLLIGAVVTYTE